MSNVVDQDFDLSGLSKVPDAGQLHQAHQARGGFGPGTKQIRMVDLQQTSPAWGSQLTAELPALDMVVEEAFISVDSAALATNGACFYMPTYWWINDQGLTLEAKGTSVYNAKSVELRDYRRLNADNQAQLAAINYLTNDVNIELARKKGSVSTQYLIDCKPLVDAVLGKAGTISAYPSNYWRISCTLKNLNQVVAAATSAAATGGALTNARLILVGHKEEQEIISNQTAALANDGIKITYSQPNHFSQSISNGSTSSVQSLPSIQGNVDQVWITTRATAGLTATAPNAVVDSPKVNRLSTATVRLGTSENPDMVWGRPVTEDFVRNGIQAFCYNNGGYYTQPAFTSALVLTTPDSYESGMMAIPLCEKASADLMHGMYSGSLRVNNNFVLNREFADPGAAQTQEVIVFIRRVIVLGLNGLLAAVNEE